MKAREFVINVPINIKIDGDGSPNLDMPNTKPADQVPDEEKVTMSPLDQELEMRKAEMGKQSKYVDQILSEPDDVDLAPADRDDSDASMDRFREDMGLIPNGKIGDMKTQAAGKPEEPEKEDKD